MASILVIEDNGPLQRAYSTILKKAGYQVTVAPDGEAALEITKNHKFDLILLDILMPHLDGIGFLRSYRKSGGEKATVIAFSNLDDEKTVKEAHELEVDEYLIKAGTSPRQILDHVEQALAKK